MNNAALSNAVTLMKDSEFRDWCVAAGAFQARAVVTEPLNTADHAVRLRLASDVLQNPYVLADRLVTVMATDTAIAEAGDNVNALDQTVFLNKVAQVWTPLAKLLYPA